MCNRYATGLLIAVSVIMGGCGFKADLFLPGQPEKIEQLDSDSLELLKQRTLESQQGGEPEGVEVPTGGAAEDPTGTDGVAVIVAPVSDETGDEEIDETNKN